MNITKREAPDWVWELVDALLKKSRDPKAKEAAQVFAAVADAARQEWDLQCWRFNLKPEQFGTTFMHRNERFTVIGIKPRSKTYPVLGRNDNGKVYKFPGSVL